MFLSERSVGFAVYSVNDRQTRGGVWGLEVPFVPFVPFV